MYVTAFFMYSPTLRLNALGLARVVAFPSAKMMKFGHISSRPRHSPFRTTVQEKIKNTSNSKDIEDNHDANDRSEVQHQIDLIILIYCVYNIYILYLHDYIHIYTHLNQFFFQTTGKFPSWRNIWRVEVHWLVGELAWRWADFMQGSRRLGWPTGCRKVKPAWWNPYHTEGNHKEMIDDILYVVCMIYIYIYMDVSENIGTPKWMVYNGNPY